MSAEATTITPQLRKILRTVALYEPVTARDVAFDVWRPEDHVRRDLAKLEGDGLVSQRYNGRAILASVTRSGRALVAQMEEDRAQRDEFHARLAAARPDDLVTCPTCQGERHYCRTCYGARVVVR